MTAIAQSIDEVWIKAPFRSNAGWAWRGAQFVWIIFLGLMLALQLDAAEQIGGDEQVSIKEPDWIGAVAFSPDATTVATGCADGRARLRDAKTGREAVVLTGHSNCVVAMAFSANGKFLATGSFDETARLWDVESGKMKWVLAGHRGAVVSVVCGAGMSKNSAAEKPPSRPESEWLATGSIDATIKIWDVTTGRLKRTLRGHKSWVNALAFDSVNGRLISGSSDGTIKIWNVDSGRVVETIQATEAEVRAIAISSDGKRLAAGLRYGFVKIWENGKERLAFKGHESDVWSVAFAPNAKLVFSGDGDWNRAGQVKVWDAQSGALLATIPHSGEVLSVRVSEKGSLAAGAGDGTLKVWGKIPHLFGSGDPTLNPKNNKTRN